MDAYIAIRTRRQENRRKKADIAATKPMVAGKYGSFPEIFTIFNGPSSGHKYDNTRTHYICGPGPNPLLACILYSSSGPRREATLHSSVDVQSPPLGIVERKGLFYNFILPHPLEGEPTRKVAMTQSGFRNTIFHFEIDVGMENLPATRAAFEWRRRKTKSFGVGARDLYQVGADEEMVCSYTVPKQDDLVRDGKMGEVTFSGAGASGELGPYWTLMAAFSAVFLCQRDIAWNQDLALLPRGALGVVSIGVALGIGLA